MYFLKHIAGDHSDPQGMAIKIIRFCDWLREKGYSESMIEAYGGDGLAIFSRWCMERGLDRPQDVTRALLERYQRHVLNSKRIKNGQPLSSGTKQKRLMAVRTFFRWLAKSRQIVYNPATDLELPRRPFQLPHQVLNIEEAERVLNAVDLNDFVGLRDRAMMEILYSTGIRRAELCRLKVHEIDIDRGWLRVEQGKYNKDRVVPIGERALFWLDKYLVELRPLLVLHNESDHIFLTRQGRPIRPKHLTRMLHEHVKKAGISKSGSCHIFRHTMATLMLEGGADIRFIQEMLGHENLDTTKIYTKVSIGKLKEVHEKTHPGAFLKRPQDDEGAPPGDALDGDYKRDTAGSCEASPAGGKT
jgi:integrase/recombinase XerD